MEKEPYPSDLTDSEWSVIEPLKPGASKLGRPPRYNKKRVLGAIFYLARSRIASAVIVFGNVFPLVSSILVFVSTPTAYRIIGGKAPILFYETFRTLSQHIVRSSWR